uniref:Protein kinase domain-containing protein n=1 Tax=Eutreptiella gymnastica TaxID=73025 RepID=A0A7S1IVJ5_9EUGL|mmetsp:Transcript_46887/g.84071  ORF Transcript_46887/g.84071 Transcript_46887/m.84071 type:complete len:493 (+) Transcript_46887:87-1565(+)
MASIVEAPSGTFSNRYTLGDELGRGSFAIVHKCVNKTNKKQFAVKVINKQKTTASQLKDLDAEIAIMKKLHHSYIIQLFDVVASATSLYLVLELCGMDVFHMICKLKHYSENVASYLMANFMNALNYIHEQGVCHRDLKPDNMLMVNAIPKAAQPGLKHEVKLLSEIKIADFGFAQECGDNHNMEKCCGTPYYIAPEVLLCGLYKTGPPYGKEADNWSAGVITYVLLSGQPAFQAQKRDQLFRLIRDKEPTFEGSVWDRISPIAKDFIQKLLIKDPQKRMTAAQALEHPWLKDKQNDFHLPSIQKDLSTFNARLKFKGAVFGVEAAHRLLYLGWCQSKSMKPNSGVVAAMEAHEGEEEDDTLDLNKNYVGKAGINAVMEVVANKQKLKKLMLAANEIENTDVDTIVHTLEKHPSVTHIDFSHNPISRTAAKKLLLLVQKNICIQRMDLDGTDIHPAKVEAIEKQLMANRKLLETTCTNLGKKVPKEAQPDPK